MKQAHKTNLALVTLVSLLFAGGIAMELKAQRANKSNQHLYTTTKPLYANNTQWETELKKKQQAAERRKQRKAEIKKQQQQQEAQIFAADIAKGCNSTAKFQKVLWTWYLVVPGGGGQFSSSLIPSRQEQNYPYR